MKVCIVFSAMLFAGGFSLVTAQDDMGIVQSAILEGVQLSSEPGIDPGEKVVTCYFIFRDKPSSYFYEIREKDKQLVFEFNDTKKGSSPIPTVTEAPISSFRVEERRININKEVKGLNPEWHDLLTATFQVNYIPYVKVNEEYNIISFSYKWNSDPARIADYTVKKRKSPVLPLTLSALGVGAAFIVYEIVKPDPVIKDGPLAIDDLPNRGDPY